MIKFAARRGLYYQKSAGKRRIGSQNIAYELVAFKIFLNSSRKTRLVIFSFDFRFDVLRILEYFDFRD